MTQVTEVAPDLFRLATFVPEIDLQFCQFLLRDEQPLLFHTGMRRLFPQVREAVREVLDPSTVRWVAFSHLEADECGALDEWLAVAPEAAAVCSRIGALVSIDDIASRPARGLTDGEVLCTGKYRLRFLHTPHVPHCWEAGLMFEEVHGTLLCSDLFYHHGDVEPVTRSDVVGRFERSLIRDEQGPFGNAYPYTAKTDGVLRRLAALEPRTLATMHGSTFQGDGAQALLDLGAVMQRTLAAA